MSQRTFRLIEVTAGSAVAALIVALVVSTGASRADSSSAAPSGKSIDYTHVVDLSHRISPKIPLWPGDPKVVFRVVAKWARDGYYLRSFKIGEHSATHMNAPNSFIEGNDQAITSYTAKQRVVPAVVIDARAQSAADADYRLTKQDVLDWEATNGRIAPGSFVIMFTGWEDRWGRPKAFINQDALGNLHFPGFAGSTTRWLLARRDISGVGVVPLEERDRLVARAVVDGDVVEHRAGLDPAPEVDRHRAIVVADGRRVEGPGPDVRHAWRGFDDPGAGDGLRTQAGITGHIVYETVASGPMPWTCSPQSEAWSATAPATPAPISMPIEANSATTARERICMMGPPCRTVRGHRPGE